MTGARLIVHPGARLTGRFRPPGDKSVTHRAYLFGALAEGRTRVQDPNPGADCEGTLACLEMLGAQVTREPDAVSIHGLSGRFAEPERVLDCGNSGTTLRLLAGVLASQPFLSVLAGDASLQRRPVDRVIEPLRRMGATLWARDGDRRPPLVIRGGALTPIRHRPAMDSAQVATAVLLAGLAAPGVTTVELGPARDHTERMLPAFGVPVEIRPAGEPGVMARSVRGPATLRAAELRVPGDFSAAAFFLAAAAASPGAQVTAQGVSLNPTRTGLLEVLAAMGADVERTPTGEEAGEPVGDVTVRGPERLEAADVPAALVPTLIDEIPAWAVAASAARGTSRVRGAADLRVKESDRIAAIARQLSALGLHAEEAPDGLSIQGGEVAGGVVDAADDHRIAMAFAVLGLRASKPVVLHGAAAIATSFPGFASTLAHLGGALEAAG